MTWFAFQGLNSGKAIDLAGIQEKDAVAIGFHGYSTEAQAEANPNAINPITQIEADLLIADYNAALQQQSQPGGKNASNPIGAAATGILNQTGIGSALNNIDDFFAKLKDGNLWLRVGEVVLGIVLIAASIGKLTGANNVVTSTVKKAIL